MKKRIAQTALAALLILAVLVTESAAAMPQDKAVAIDNQPSVPIFMELTNAVAITSRLRTNVESSMKTSNQARTTFYKRPSVTSEADLLAQGSEVEKLKTLIPETIAEAEAKVPLPRNRFLMWTHDLEHVMWGYYRNGFFVGKDNHGVRAWGVYGNGYFAGLYKGEFFWGKYDSGRWKAKNLFGEQETTHGGYTLAPAIVAVRYTAQLQTQADYAILPRPPATLARATLDCKATSLIQSAAIPDEAERLRKRIPGRIEEAEEAMRPLKGRFLMWTKDLRHVMWGCFGNGYFVGNDNLGRRAWGIYGEQVFAGLYDGEFFWGFYGNGRWRAFGLFGERRTHGRYLTARNS